MNKSWQFYDRATGLFSSRAFAGPERALAANTPDGCAAIEGRYDRNTQRVDVASGQVVAYQRPVSEVDTERREADRRRARRRIDELERAQLRPLRELAIEPANQEAKRRLEQIEDEIVRLRVLPQV